MADSERLEAVLELVDNYSEKLADIVEKTKRAKQAFEKVKPAIEARDKASGKIDRIRQAMKKLKDIRKNVDVKDLASRKIRKIQLDLMKLKAKAILVSIKDKASRVADLIGVKIKAVAKKWMAHIGLKDGMSGVLSKLKSGLTALLAVATAVGAAIGKSITDGAKLEQQMVSTEHFIRVANPGKSGIEIEKMSDKYINGLRKNASSTPYTTNDVMNAGSRAIQISGGDTGQAMRLVKLAEDMAAADPNKTLGDAIEAIADAQMGEFERMKEFGFKGSKEAFDKAGGDFFKMKGADGKTVSQVFGGLSKEQADTSAGIFSSIVGNIGDAKNSFGLGFLDGIKPKLIEIRKALDDMLGGDSMNKIQNFGKQVGEGFLKAVNFVKQFAQGVKNVFEMFAGGFLSGFDTTWLQEIGEAFSNLGNMMMEKAPAMQAIFSGLGFVMGTLATIATFVFNVIVQVVTAAIGIVNGIINGAISVINAIKSAWESLKQKVSNAANSIKSFAEGCFNGIAGAIKKAKDWIDKIGNAWTTLKSKIESNPIVQTIRKVVTGDDEGGTQRAIGLNRVPYNGYKASLHEGERILTRNEANRLEKGSGANISITVNATYNYETDEDKTIDKLVRQLKLAYP